MGLSHAIVQEHPVDLRDPIVSDAISSMGEGLYSRRLTDKILSAFNQAYATGEFAVADILRQAMDEAIGRSEEVGGGRKTHPAVTQANLWVEFVNARNAYKSATDPLSGASSVMVDSAMDRMKDAYRNWSEG